MPILAAIRHHPLIAATATIVVLPIVIFACWAMIALSFTYSKGERAGFLLKVSERGWLCKTWEGELQMVAIPGAAPEKFLFSTRSDSIATVLNRLAGQRVVLDYAQHRGVPGSCFGDTEYFVTGVRAVPAP